MVKYGQKYDKNKKWIANNILLLNAPVMMGISMVV